jgi:hypothetical protein
MADELDLMTAEGYDKQGFEKEAARRVQARILAGTWKPPAKDDTHGLQRQVGQALELILNGEVSWLATQDCVHGA